MNNSAALAGTLDFLNLGDLIQLFGSNGSTGVLRIMSDHTPEPGIIYIQQGSPINAFKEDLTGTDALYALFGYVEGRFEFVEQEVSGDKVITKGRMEIILDGLRKLDDGEIQKLGAPAKNDDAAMDDGSDGNPLIKGPLVDYAYVADEEEYQDGQEIAVETKHGNWIWVVVQGVIQIRKDTPNGRINIARITDGAFLGSMATFTASGNTRSATSVAVGHVSLAVLDTQRLFSEFSAYSMGYREVLLSLDHRVREVTNRLVDLHTKSYSMEDYIKGRKPAIKQGSKDARLFKIVEGDATVVRKTDNGVIPLGRLGKGDYFGKFPFFDMRQEPHGASVLVSQDFKHEEVDAEALMVEYERSSPTFKRLIEHLSNCVAVTTRLAGDALKKSKS